MASGMLASFVGLDHSGCLAPRFSATTWTYASTMARATIPPVTAAKVVPGSARCCSGGRTLRRK